MRAPTSKGMEKKYREQVTVGRIRAPEDVHILVSGISSVVFADVIKLRTLRWAGYHRLFGWAHNLRVLPRERGGRESQRQGR